MGKIILNNIIVKGFKSKDHADGNVTMAWDKRKNKYEPLLVPPMVKLDRQLRDYVLKKGDNPEVRITRLEDVCARHEDIGSDILERQFMIHVLNNITSNYGFQVALGRIEDVENP
jgi:hypothetical protein